MAGRDIKIPFGPDKTGGIPLDALAAEGEAEPLSDPFDEPAPLSQAVPPVSVPDDQASAPSVGSLSESLPNPADIYAQAMAAPSDYSAPTADTQAFAASPAEQGAPSADAHGSASSSATTWDAVAQPAARDVATQPAAREDVAPSAAVSASPFEAGYGAARESLSQEAGAPRASEAVAEAAAPADDDYHPGGLTEDEATAQGMDEMQMSILALKDSIGQGRELKEREKERKELAEALEADHIELADREEILANYQAIVSEQDAIINDRTQRRDAAKAELAQITATLGQTQSDLEDMRALHAQQLQPLETDLGRARAAADQAKNDERSRKSELNAAESELRRAGDGDANIMGMARYQQVKAAYDEARSRSEGARAQLAQVQKAYDETKQRFEQAEGPLDRSREDMINRIEALKGDVNSLGEELSAALNRRQYCDTVYQYPNETAKMRAEVEQAEALARQMDVENEALREQLAQSKKKARMAKIALGVVIAIVVLIVLAFIAIGGR